MLATVKEMPGTQARSNFVLGKSRVALRHEEDLIEAEGRIEDIGNFFRPTLAMHRGHWYYS